jgi:hypothetical protein
MPISDDPNPFSANERFGNCRPGAMPRFEKAENLGATRGGPLGRPRRDLGGTLGRPREKPECRLGKKPWGIKAEKDPFGAFSKGKDTGGTRGTRFELSWVLPDVRPGPGAVLRRKGGSNPGDRDFFGDPRGAFPVGKTPGGTPGNRAETRIEKPGFAQSKIERDRVSFGEARTIEDGRF